MNYILALMDLVFLAMALILAAAAYKAGYAKGRHDLSRERLDDAFKKADEILKRLRADDDDAGVFK